MKEFANRKRSTEKDKKQNDDSASAKYSKCKAAESTGTKVLTHTFAYILYPKTKVVSDFLFIATY